MVNTMASPVGSERSMRSVTHAKNGTVACTVCSALYAPSQAHVYLTQAPHIALESAFMSMCRFCFRCRRPACPLCWDDVHGLCGACVEEVHLPFRKEAEPLPLDSTLLVSSSPQLKQQHSVSFPLVSIRPGSFHADIAQKEDVVLLPKADGAISSLPIGQHQELRPAQEAVVPMDVQESKDLTHIAQRVEGILTVILGVILLVIAVLIVVASLSAQANTVIVYVLHVDIRMEIEYLLQLMQQFH